tara:strand:+ start:2516 stop:2743 length:228 start_codon:yes stop_codon:yes gene_type:complete
VKLSKQRLRQIIKEELGEVYSREEVKQIMNAPSGAASPPTTQLREPWEGIEENAERLDILSNQIGALARALGVEL